MSTKSPTLCCVITAYNEEKNLERAVNDFTYGIEESRRFADYRFLIVNDGSQDRTPEIGARLARENPRVEFIDNGANLGIGRSYTNAIQRISDDTDFILLGFGDAPNVRTELPSFFAAVQDDSLTCAHHPNLKSVKVFWRVWLSQLFTWILNFWYRFDVQYYNGMAIYPTKALKEVNIRSRNFGVHAELIIRLRNRGLRFTEVGLNQNVYGVQFSNALKPKNIYGVLKLLLYLFIHIPRKAMSKIDHRQNKGTML